jgi:hypothetical protein
MSTKPKPKLGVYVASYNQPVFLRHSLLQIAQQTRLPDVLAIHENANRKSYRPLVEDVLETIRSKGVKVLYQHTGHQMDMPTFFCLPLANLVDEGCDLYQKLDVDDIYYAHHLDNQVELIWDKEYGYHPYDYVINSNAELLVLPTSGPYLHNPKVNFGIWNPTGGHPNNIIFKKAVAEAFIKAMYAHKPLNDDTIFAAHVMPKFLGNTISRDATMCFVAHGKNVSVPHWSVTPPSQVLG